MNFAIIFGLLIAVIIIIAMISIFAKLNTDINAINNTIASIYTPSTKTLSVDALAANTLTVSGQANMGNIAVTGNNRVTNIFNDPAYGGRFVDPVLHIASGLMDATINYDTELKRTGIRLGVSPGGPPKATFL